MSNITRQSTMLDETDPEVMKASLKESRNEQGKSNSSNVYESYFVATDGSSKRDLNRSKSRNRQASHSPVPNNKEGVSSFGTQNLHSSKTSAMTGRSEFMVSNIGDKFSSIQVQNAELKSLILAKETENQDLKKKNNFLTEEMNKMLDPVSGKPYLKDVRIFSWSNTSRNIKLS